MSVIGLLRLSHHVQGRTAASLATHLQEEVRMRPNLGPKISTSSV